MHVLTMKIPKRCQLPYERFLRVFLGNVKHKELFKHNCDLEKEWKIDVNQFYIKSFWYILVNVAFLFIIIMIWIMKMIKKENGKEPFSDQETTLLGFFHPLQYLSVWLRRINARYIEVESRLYLLVVN